MQATLPGNFVLASGRDIGGNLAVCADVAPASPPAGCVLPHPHPLRYALPRFACLTPESLRDPPPGRPAGGKSENRHIHAENPKSKIQNPNKCTKYPSSPLDAKFLRKLTAANSFHAAQRIIVYAWVNDDDTKRAYESSDYAYRVFRKMIDTGHPLDDWDALLKEARAASRRLHKLKSSP